MKEKATYLLFIVVVYESKDPIGNFVNSTSLELICDNREDAEARALKIAGSTERCYVHTKMVLEKRFDERVSCSHQD